MNRFVSIGTIVFSALVAVFLVFPRTEASAQHKGQKPADVRLVNIGKTLIDCFNELKDRDGGWCRMGRASINRVLPKSPSREINMVTGPKSVIGAWNGAAFDFDNLKMYFHGGGHRDYGGNGVYELDLLAGKWKKLTDPSYIPPASNEVRCPVPISGPPSSHTYDGIIFSRVTQTIFVIPSVYGCHYGNLNPVGDLWEFNPSETEMRNGMFPKSWRHRKQMPKRLFPKFYRTAEYPNGDLYVANLYNEWVFNPRTDAWKRIGSRPNYGAGASIYDAFRDGVWSLHRDGILFTKPPAIAKKWSVPGAGVDGHSGLAMTSDNKIITWDGASFIHIFDPDTREWRLFDWKKTDLEMADVSI